MVCGHCCTQKLMLRSTMLAGEGQEMKSSIIKTMWAKVDIRYFSLTWTFQFPHDRDTCYFAHCYPYTYSNLQEYLVDISKDPEKSKFCKIRILCRSLAGNIVYVLTITNPPESGNDTKRKAVILTARVHPGETNSSWIMKGFLDYILGNSHKAQQLRDTFVFKVVPMLNPDGVIVGNHRCSLTGKDLNRKYKCKVKKCYPSIWYTRNMIRSSQTSDSSDSCDLPAHRQKLGTKKDNKTSGDHFNSIAKDRNHESKYMPGTETQHKIFQESDPVEKVKLPITASAKQVGKDFSPERLTHDAEGNGRNTSVPQKSRKSVWPDINLSTRESFQFIQL
uniref:Peptidase M14 domain-containing protein n=1 Tax=Anas platyrhynchos TaxID=8839 RepID=A0A8B9R5H4_ANAPL